MKLHKLLYIAAKITSRIASKLDKIQEQVVRACGDDVFAPNMVDKGNGSYSGDIRGDGKWILVIAEDHGETGYFLGEEKFDNLMDAINAYKIKDPKCMTKDESESESAYSKLRDDLISFDVLKLKQFIKDRIEFTIQQFEIHGIDTQQLFAFHDLTNRNLILDKKYKQADLSLAWKIEFNETRGYPNKPYFTIFKLDDLNPTRSTDMIGLVRSKVPNKMHVQVTFQDPHDLDHAIRCVMDEVLAIVKL